MSPAAKVLSAGSTDKWRKQTAEWTNKTASGLCIPGCFYKYRQKNNDTIAGLAKAGKIQTYSCSFEVKGVINDSKRDRRDVALLMDTRHIWKRCWLCQSEGGVSFHAS